MKNWGMTWAVMLLAGSAVWATESVAANKVAKIFGNRAFYCKGGNESAGHNYTFRVSGNQIERMDYRFPGKNVMFQVGVAKKGTLANNWSYETLTEVSGGKMHLYERVSLRSSQQNKHVYRTYEIYSRGGKVFMVLYDGVNGARDWKIRMTRNCGFMRGNRIVQNGNRYWSTTFSN